MPHLEYESNTEYDQATVKISINESEDIDALDPLEYKGIIKFNCPGVIEGTEYPIVVKLFNGDTEVYRYTSVILRVTADIITTNLTILNPIVSFDTQLSTIHYVTDVAMSYDYVYYFFFDPKFDEWSIKEYDDDFQPIAYYNFNDTEFVTNLKSYGTPTTVSGYPKQYNNTPVSLRVTINNQLDPGMHNVSLWSTNQYSLSNILNSTFELRSRPTISITSYPKLVKTGDPITFTLKVRYHEYDLEYFVYLNEQQFFKTFPSSTSNRKLLSQPRTITSYDQTVTAPTTPGNFTYQAKITYKDIINSTNTADSKVTIAVRSPPVVNTVSVSPINIESQAMSMRLIVTYTDLDSIDQLSVLYRFDMSSDYNMYPVNLTITQETGTLDVEIHMPPDRSQGAHQIYVKLIDSYYFESNTDQFCEFYIRYRPVVSFISLDRDFYTPGDQFVATIRIEDQDDGDMEKIEYKVDQDYILLQENVVPSDNIMLQPIPISVSSQTSPLTYYIRVTDRYGFSDEISIDVPIHFRPKLRIINYPEKVVPGKKFPVVIAIDDLDPEDYFTIYYKENNDFNIVTDYSDPTTILISVSENSQPGEKTLFFYCVDRYNLQSEDITLTTYVKGRPKVSITGPEDNNVIPGMTSTLKVIVTDPDQNDRVKVFVNGSDIKTFYENSFDVEITIPNQHGVFVISSNAIDEDGLVSETNTYSFEVRDPPKIVSCKLDKETYVAGDEFIPTCTFNDIDSNDYLTVLDNTTGKFDAIDVHVSMTQTTLENQIKSYTIPQDFEGNEFNVYIQCYDKYYFYSNIMEISASLRKHPQLSNVRINKEYYVRGDHIIVDGEASDEDENDVITVNLYVNNDIYSQTILANSSERSFHFDVLVKEEYEIGTLDIRISSIDSYGLKSIPEIDLSKPLYFIPIIKSVEAVDQIYVSPSNSIKIKVTIEDLDSNDLITVLYKRETDPEFNNLETIQSDSREGIFDILIPDGTMSGPFNIEFQVIDSHSLVSSISNIVVQVRIPPKITTVSSSKEYYSRGELVVVDGKIEDPDQNDEYKITIKIGDLFNTITVQSQGEITPFTITLDKVQLGDWTAEITAVDKSSFSSNTERLIVKVREAPKLTNLAPYEQFFIKGNKVVIGGNIEDEDQNDEFTITMKIGDLINTITVQSQGESTTFSISLENVPVGDWTAEISAVDKSMFRSNTELVDVKVTFVPIITNLTTTKPFFAKGETVVINGNIEDEDQNDIFKVIIRYDSSSVEQSISSTGLNTPFSFSLDQVPVGDTDATVYVTDIYGNYVKSSVQVKVRVAPVISDLSFEEKRYKKGEELTLHFTFYDEDANDYVTFNCDIGSSPINDETHYDTSTTPKSGTMTFVIPEDCEQGLVDISLQATDSNYLKSNILTKQIYILSNPIVKYKGKNIPKNAKPLDNVTVYFSVSNPDSDEIVSVYISVNNSEQIFLDNLTSPVENYMFNYTIFIPLDHPNYTIPYNFTAIDSTGLIGRNQTEIVVASHPPIIRYTEEFMPYKLNSTVPVRFCLMDEDNDDPLSVDLHLFRKNYSLNYKLLENEICNNLTNLTVNIQLPDDIEDNEYTVVITATDRAGLQSSDETKLLVNTKAQFGQDGQVNKFEIIVDERWYIVLIVSGVIILSLLVILSTILRCFPPRNDHYLEFDDDSQIEEEEILEKEAPPIKNEFNSEDVLHSAGEQIGDSDSFETLSTTNSDIMHQNLPTFV